MTTLLALRNTQNNGIGSSYYDLVVDFGSATDTAVVNTTAGGTEIQWTKTAGGAVAQWITGRVPAGGFTLTALNTINIWCHESAMAANCGGRVRVFKRAADTTETELGGGPFNDGVEFGTTTTQMDWSANPTDTAFAENDRILLKVYITNVGTMGGGETCTLTFNGPAAGTGDSAITLNETVAFKAEEKILSAGSGSFAFTGTDASLEQGYKVAADAGAFSFTGSAATLSKGITIHVDAGSFSFTGDAATLRKTWLLSAEAGSFSFTGTAASLEHGYKIIVEVGSYVFTGSDATLTATSVAAPTVEEPFRGTGGWGAGLGWPLSRKKRSQQEQEEEERRERAEAALDRVLDDVLVIQPAIRARDEREAAEADLLYNTFDEWDRLAA